MRSSEYQKNLKSSGSFSPRTPSQLRCYFKMALQRAPSKCWATAAGAERLAARAAARGQILRGGGTRGSHFPALFDYFNLERKPVLGIAPDAGAEVLFTG